MPGFSKSARPIFLVFQSLRRCHGNRCSISTLPRWNKTMFESGYVNGKHGQITNNIYCSEMALKRYMSDSHDKGPNNGVINVERDWGTIENDSDYDEFSQKVFRMKMQGHSVLVVQPYKRKRKDPDSITTPTLRLSESVALVQSIPNWSVVSAVACSVKSLKATEMFKSGNMSKIVSKIRENEKITAVFVSVDILTIDQLVELQKAFEVPVYDRYTLVIQIFHNHAYSKAAKLQVAMAEIPYLKQCLDGIPEGLEDRLGGDFAAIGGASRSSLERRREMLKRREHRLRSELEGLAKQRQVIRTSRARKNTPTVAIVGYTNAGKTSLIQILTKEIKIQPKNRLFATLDVSSHLSTLPSGLKIVYVDTVGFMSDLPDSLIESFKATLEDALYADILIHIWDVSHPESTLQIQHVSKILSNLSVEKKALHNMLIVGNKIDKIKESEREDLLRKYPHITPISCTTGEGIVELENSIQEHIIKITDRRSVVLKVRSGSPEHFWLLENATVTTSNVDENENYMLVNTLMTEGQFNKFKSLFIIRQKQRHLHFE